MSGQSNDVLSYDWAGNGQGKHFFRIWFWWAVKLVRKVEHKLRCRKYYACRRRPSALIEGLKRDQEILIAYSTTGFWSTVHVTQLILVQFLVLAQPIGQPFTSKEIRIIIWSRSIADGTWRDGHHRQRPVSSGRWGNTLYVLFNSGKRQSAYTQRPFLRDTQQVDGARRAFVPARTSTFGLCYAFRGPY